MSSRIVEYWRRLTSPLESAQSALKEKHWEEATNLYERLRHSDPEDWRGYGEACVAYRQLGDWDKANGIIEEGLAKLGEQRELLIAYGDTAMDSQRWEEALGRWARLRQACPDDERGWVRAAKALLQLERTPQARQMLSEGNQLLGEREGLTKFQQEIESRLKALLEAAQHALKEKHWEEAVQHYERLRHSDPEEWRGYGEACVAYRQLGDWDKANGIIEEGLAKLGEQRELLIAYGDTAMDSQRWEEALGRWARLRQACPDDERGWVRAAKALLQLERTPQARQMLSEGNQLLGEREGLTKVQQEIESRLKALLESAQSALKEKHWEEATNLYERLRHSDPEEWRGYGEACMAYRQLGDWDKANGIIEEGLAKLGERWELLIAYGDTAMDSQRWEEALGRWARLRQACPDDERGWVRPVEALVQLERIPEAQQMLAEGSQLLGEREGLTKVRLEIESRLKALLEAAQSALKENRWEEAVQCYERLKQHDPNDWRSYGEACVAYRQLGDWDKADGITEEGLAKLGERRELLIAYGDTAMDIQRWEEALGRWARLRQVCPDDERGWVRAAKVLLQLERTPQARQMLAEGSQLLGEREGLTKVQQEIESRLKALLEAAQHALKEKHWEEAVQHYERLRHSDPEEWRGYGEACVAYRQLGDWDKANGIIEEGLAKLGEHRELLIAYGDTAMDSQRWEEALMRWERMKRVHPRDPSPYKRAVEAANRTNDEMLIARAFASYRKQFGLPNPDPITWRLLEAASSKVKKQRRICFVSGTGFSGHGKYAYLYLFKNSVFYDIEICWITDLINEYEMLLSKGLPALYWDMSPPKADYLLHADISIYQTHDPIPKGGGIRQACLAESIKVQLWHGIPAKSVGYKDFLRWGNVDEFARYGADALSYDHVIIESENVASSYRAAFPPSKLNPLGGCRTDILLRSPIFEDHEVWMGVQQPLKTYSNRKLILYAPTYREPSQNIDPFITALQELIALIENMENFILAIKPHPAFISETKLDLSKFALKKPNVIFIRGQEDIYPWAACADYLVTDYSSIYYDFLITKKPIVFFRPDVELYDSTRNRIVYPFETGIEPGPVVTTAAEIPNALLESDDEKWRLNRVALAEKFHTLPHDGMVTKRVADFIVSLLRV